MTRIILFALTVAILLIWVPLTFAVLPDCDPPGQIINGECVFPDGGSGAGGNNIEPVLPSNPATNFGSGSNLIGDFVTKILPIAIGIGGFLTVIFIAISGIQFITSSGNPEGANAARTRLTFAIIGFVILALSFVIVKLIDNIFLGTEIFG